VAASVHPRNRDNALQIRPLTRRGTHQPAIDVEDTNGARGGDAKTNMANSMLIAINIERDESTYLPRSARAREQPFTKRTRRSGEKTAMLLSPELKP